VNKVIVALFVAFVAAITGIALYTNLKNRYLIPPPVSQSEPLVRAG
jgi:hypothetical protein